MSRWTSHKEFSVSLFIPLKLGVMESVLSGKGKRNSRLSGKKSAASRLNFPTSLWSGKFPKHLVSSQNITCDVLMLWEGCVTSLADFSNNTWGKFHLLLFSKTTVSVQTFRKFIISTLCDVTLWANSHKSGPHTHTHSCTMNIYYLLLFCKQVVCFYFTFQYKNSF